jgi:transposase
MANQLTMALIDTVRTLHARGWPARRIARELGIHRDTVARYLHSPDGPAKPANAPSGSDVAEAAAKPANAPSGSDVAETAAKPANAPPGSDVAETAAKPANAPPGSAVAGQAESARDGDELSPTNAALTVAADSGTGRRSDCQPYRTIIEAKLDQGLTAQRIFQDLAGEHGFPGSYYSVRRFVHQLEQGTPLPFRRMECAAGEEAQVDFGQGAPIVDAQGRRRRPHVLRIVLSYSRKGYSEVVDRQTTDDFLRSLENAFWSFGGVPQRLVLDNLRAAVSKCDWFEPEINPKVRSFADYYGIALLPTRPYTPRHKGKVERGVDYVQENALRGRTFASLEEQNTFLHSWEETVADRRVHGTTRQQVGKRFVEVERAALRPLPADRFPFFHEAERSVHRDGYVEVARAYYSAPPEYVGRRVWVRWDGRLVRLFNQRLEQVAVHVQQEAGRFSTHDSHIATAKRSGVERGPAWLLPRIGKLGSQAVQWSEAMLKARGVEGVRVLQGLLALAARHAAADIDRACGIASAHGEYRLRTIRALVVRTGAKEEPSPLIEEHPVIRSLAEYDRVVQSSLAKEQ